ncbi:MAG TPA: molybdopterin oxidoreductase family protein, partial [Candidatus Brocadiaceae bacterium]
VNYPNGKEIREAFKKIGFIVVQDTFLTETAQLADVVLPATTFAEREGTFTNMGMTVQRLNQAIQPSAEAKPDWQIICDLAKKMGQPYSYLSTKEILSEIESAVPIYTGVNYDRLKRKEFQWVSSFYERNKPAEYTFDVIKPESLDIIKRTDFPFLLLTGASLNHQGAFSRHSKHLILVAPECFLEINEKDSEDMHIKDGDWIWVESAQNKLKLKARVTQKSPKGVVFVSEDYEWIPVNLLRNKTYTPVKIYKEMG